MYGSTATPPLREVSVMRSVTVAASFGVANGRFARVNPLVPFSGPGETLPYHESDHVLNIAYNVLVGGQRLEDIELRR